MAILKVPEMHCEKCVERIENALNEGGLKFSVSLSEQTVTVDGCDSCVKSAVSLLDDLGFSAEEID